MSFFFLFFCVDSIVYLLSCLFCFVWTWTCFFKLSCVECRLINGGYNSWKPSQCFPVGFTYILRSSLWSLFSPFSLLPLLVCLTVSLPRRLARSPSSNQLNQTVESTSCPSGALCPPLPVLCYLSREPTHCAHFLLARPGKQSWRGKGNAMRRKHGMRLCFN